MRGGKILLVLLLVCGGTLAQSIEVEKIRDLDFGTFTLAQGGSITILSQQETRSATGDVLLMSSSYGCAIYHISTRSTTPIRIKIDQPVVELIAPTGGKAVLEYAEAHPHMPTVVAGSPVIVRIGGTLHLGPQMANPSGAYSGTGLINFSIHNE